MNESEANARGWRAVLDLLAEVYREWQDDKVSRLAAALAYYTLFSLAPLLVIAVAIAGLIFGEAAARQEMLAQAQDLLGSSGAEAIETLLENANHEISGQLAALIGLITLLLGASGVFGQLQDTLNIIWNVPPQAGSGVRNYVSKRLVSFAMVLAAGFLLLVSLVISAGLSAINSLVTDNLPAGVELVSMLLNFLISFGVVTLLFAILYRWIPDTEVGWRDVLPGALVTSLLFNVGKTLIGLYLGRSSINTSYGAAGSLIVVLVWIYYSAQIVFLGAEFAQVYARHREARQRVPPGYPEALLPVMNLPSMPTITVPVEAPGGPRRNRTKDPRPWLARAALVLNSVIVVGSVLRFVRGRRS